MVLLSQFLTAIKSDFEETPLQQVYLEHDNIGSAELKLVVDALKKDINQNIEEGHPIHSLILNDNFIIDLYSDLFTSTLVDLSGI